VRVYDVEKQKGATVAEDRTGTLYLGTAMTTTEGSLVWGARTNGTGPQTVSISTLAVPPTTKYLTETNASVLMFWNKLTTNNRLMGAAENYGPTQTLTQHDGIDRFRQSPDGYFIVPDDEFLFLASFFSRSFSSFSASSSSSFAPLPKVPHPLDTQRALIKSNDIKTGWVVSLDLDSGDLATLQLLEQTDVDIYLRYLNSSNLFLWSTRSYTGGPTVVWSVEAPFTKPDTVVARLSVVLLDAFTETLVDGCLAYFADKSPDPRGSPQGWSVGFVGVRPNDRSLNTTCKPTLRNHEL